VAWGIWKPLGYIVLIIGSCAAVNKIMMAFDWNSNIFFIGLVFISVMGIAVFLEYLEEKYGAKQ